MAVRFSDSTSGACSDVGKDKWTFDLFCQSYQVVVVPSWRDWCEDTRRVGGFRVSVSFIPAHTKTVAYRPKSVSILWGWSVEGSVSFKHLPLIGRLLSIRKRESKDWLIIEWAGLVRSYNEVVRMRMRDSKRSAEMKQKRLHEPAELVVFLCIRVIYTLERRYSRVQEYEYSFKGSRLRVWKGWVTWNHNLPFFCGHGAMCLWLSQPVKFSKWRCRHLGRYLKSILSLHIGYRI